MRWLMALAVRLYPRAWRVRYEEEFRALLEDVNPSWRAALDVLGAAVVMRLKAISLGRIVWLSGLVGLLGGFGTWVLSPNRFVSQAVIKIEGPGFSHRALSDYLAALARGTVSRRSLYKIILDRDLYAAERRREPLEDIAGQMREHITIKPYGTNSALLQFDSTDQKLSKRSPTI
jgi:hypothetical protein